MRKFTLKFWVACVIGCAVGFGGISMGQAQSACGDVSVAAMNWQSAELLAAVDRFILEHGYGCNASIVSADTVPAFTSMVEKGQPDIVPEGWIDLVSEIVRQGLEEKSLVDLGPSIAEGGKSGLFIPKYVADAHPEIKTIEDAFNHWEVFPSPENPSKGALYNGPQGYGGTVVTTQLYKAYKAEVKNFELIDTGSAAGLDGALIRAQERGEPILAFYWEPTSLLGRYEMVQLDSGVHDEAEWKRCTAVGDCPDPKPNGWAPERIHTVISTPFSERANAQVLDYLRKRSYENKLVNRLLVWMSDNQATGEEGARHFLNTNKEIWQGWVSSEAAAKIEAAL